MCVCTISNVAMIFKTLVLVFIIKFYTVFGDIQFGPYKLVVLNLTTCPGSLGTQEVDMYLEKDSSGVQHVKIDGYFKNTVGPLGADLTWSIFKKTNYVAVFSLQTKRVCDILKNKQATIASMFPKVDSRCFLLKGPYHQELADVNAANHALLGNTMPYGRYMAKMTLNVGRKLLLCKQFYYECVRV